MAKTVVILGGGISGLSAAWYLEKRGFTDIVLLEASGRLGGKIRTTTTPDGFVVENGPDSYITTKPYAVDLIKDLGLGDEMIAPLTGKFYILKGGEMHPAPKGLRMMVPTSPDSLEGTGLFTEEGKKRVAEEAEIPPRSDDGDESFASFVERRFGKEMLDNYAEPLFGGIYATPSDEMSMAAAFPMLLAWEKKYGSITAAVQSAPAPPQEAGRSSFMSLKRGMQSLVDALDEKLQHTRIRLNCPVSDLSHTESGRMQVSMQGGETMVADAVIAALPAPVLKQLLQSHLPEAAEQFTDLTSASSHIVSLVYEASQFDTLPDHTGFVSAKDETGEVTAGTWTSAKWPGRAPEGYVLLRCFFGKAGALASDEYLLNQAHAAIQHLLHVKGDPYRTWVHHWSYALPQYRTGHLDRIARLRQTLSQWPGLHIAGAFLEGVGIPDCIRLGKEAAEGV